MNSILVLRCLAILLFALTHVIPIAVASDRLSVDEVNLLLKGSEEAYSTKDYYLGLISNERQKVIPNDELSEGNFILDCAHIHYLISDFPNAEAKLEFFQNEKFFARYIDGHWRDNEELKSIWYQYYKISAGFFLQIGNLADAERCFIKASEIKIDRKALIDAIKIKCRNDLSENISYTGELGPFYERIRIFHGVEQFDGIDCQHLAFFYGLSPVPDVKQMNYMLHALELPWPSPKDPMYLTDKNSFKKDVPKVFYKFGKFAEAKDYLLRFPQSALSSEHLKILAVVLALESDYVSSFRHFKDYWRLVAPSNTIVVSAEELETLITMLASQSEGDFNNVGLPWIKKVLGNTDAGKKILSDVLQQKKENRARYIAGLKNFLAFQILEDCKREYHFFDSEYQKLWGHASSLAENDMQQVLNAVQKIGESISEQYVAITDIFNGENVLDLIKIRELNNDFILSIRRFSSLRKELDHKISNLRRAQFKREPFQEEFVESPWSLSNSSVKAGVLSAHKKTEQGARRKADLKNQRIKFEHASTADTTPQFLSASPQNLRSFKEHKLGKLWASRSLPDAALEALDALQNASSMFHLRKLLRPGAKLEMLKGDREGQISIRVNDQNRLCFVWLSGQGAFDIELTDYHR